MGISVGTVLTGIKVWRKIRPIQRIKEARKEQTSEQIEIETTEEVGMKLYRKFLVAATGGVLALGSRWIPGLEDADAQGVVEAVVLLLTALGVYRVPNSQ